MGGVRTALYNYLFARKNGGTFILRIEDTDQGRYVPGAEQYILDSLAWCGLQPDEGIGASGDLGPYRQSERKEIYAQYAARLVESGHAYYAFDTPEEITQAREAAKAEGNHNWQYDSSTRGGMKNSLSLGDEEAARLMDSPKVVRFRMPEQRSVIFNDEIRGEVTYDTSVLDDKVLFKADGMPTYHMANVVDDHLMEITHVIRGEEWLPSTPLHVLLYEAFGWQAPAFAHLPLILKPDGNGKLSKRDGDRLGFPVFPLEWTDPASGDKSSGYREQGYIPEAFINMLLMLGWNPGTEEELFDHNKMIELFSLDRVVKSGAKFSPDKARWFNEQYLKAMSTEDLATAVRPWADGIDESKLASICGLMAQRSTLLPDLLTAGYLLHAPDQFNEKVLKKRWKENTPEIMARMHSHFSGVEDFSSENLDSSLQQFVSENELGFGQVGPALRLLLTGEGGGPNLNEIMSFLGKEESLSRIESGLQKLETWTKSE